MRAMLPLVVLVVAALAGVIVWLVYATTHPPARPYIVTPDSFQQLSERGLSATDETWQLSNGTAARGWLLRGKQSAPAVIFLHPYGGNRSYFLNLGIKLNEATNFTVLWIDARGHGAESPTGGSSFGTREAGDIAAAATFLRTLTTRNGEPLTGGNIGIYGVEMGAYTALVAAADNPGVRVLVLDSVITSPGELLDTALAARTGLTDPISRFLAGAGARLYFVGNFPGATACEAAAKIGAQRVLLLAGADAGALQASTRQLQGCFPTASRIEQHLELPLTGFRVASANSVEAETYDRRVIEFFDRTLRDDQ